MFFCKNICFKLFPTEYFNLLISIILHILDIINNSNIFIHPVVCLFTLLRGKQEGVWLGGAGEVLKENQLQTVPFSRLTQNIERQYEKEIIFSQKLSHIPAPFNSQEK